MENIQDIILLIGIIICLPIGWYFSKYGTNLTKLANGKRWVFNTNEFELTPNDIKFLQAQRDGLLELNRMNEQKGVIMKFNGEVLVVPIVNERFATYVGYINLSQDLHTVKIQASLSSLVIFPLALLFLLWVALSSSSVLGSGTMTLMFYIGISYFRDGRPSEIKNIEYLILLAKDKERSVVNEI